MNQRSGKPGDLSALSPWVNELAQTFVSLSSDIALVLDGGGVITQVAQSQGEPMAPSAAQWVGRRWADTVTGETRRKIELLLGDVASTGLARRREVSHPAGAAGAEIPVAYTAIRLGHDGPVLAVGRDLRAIAAIQQRFLDAQQELERGYWKARQAETRERALLQVATDAVLVVDAESGAVISANPVAAQRVGLARSALAGRRAAEFFDEHSRNPVEELMAAARSSGRPVELRARLAGSQSLTSVSATAFRVADRQRLLLRLRSVEIRAPGAAPALPIAGVGEAVAIADSSGRIRSCDAAFVALLGARDEAALVGRSLGDCLGEPAALLDELLAEVRREGLAERAGLRLRPASGTVVAADLSASWLTEDDQEGVGLVLRRRAVRDDAAAAAQQAFAAAWAALDSQLGHASLPDLLREAGALAERHFIGQALQRAGGDTAAAARLLGVSSDRLVQRSRGQDEQP